MMRCLRLSTNLLILLLLLAPFSRPSFASGASPAEQLSKLARHLDAALSRLESSDLHGAQTAYKRFEDGWEKIEDGIREKSKTHYRAIEDAMGEASYLLNAEPFDSGKAKSAIKKLRERANSFIKGETAPATQTPAPGQEKVTVRSLVTRLERAEAELEAGDATGAAAEIAAFRREWTEVEGLVKGRSAQAYAATENNMAEAYALLTKNPPEAGRARLTLARMKADLQPFSAEDPRYGIFDAAVILFREGIEAMLVVAALLAFLARTKHVDKKPWVWAGSAAGVMASVLIAFVVNLAFSQAAAGVNRELLEGFTGLAAAAMLVYVGHWLHSKTSLGGWHRYIHERTTAALSRNSLLSLALIAFLAVFREGAETVLFYVGIAPSIALGDLIWGLVLGAAGLSLIGLLILTFGVRVPIRPFFLGTSLLLYYLAFKFVGTGIHALQVAGILSATPGNYLPENNFLGLFPTWETTMGQAAIVLSTTAVILMSRLREPAHGNRAR